MPKLQLVHFERVLIPTSSTYVIKFTLLPDQMAIYDDYVGFVVKPGNQ